MKKYKRILIATHNDGKLEEFKIYLSPFVEEILSLRMLNDSDEVIENAHTYEGNAIKKATYFHNKYQIPTISDDSGLEIDALGQYPGIYSARIGETDYIRNQIVLNKLGQKQNRLACMVSVIAFVDKKSQTFKGVLCGNITKKPVGQLGFGYDAIFYVDAINKTLGQITRKEKLSMSHRGIALKKLIQSIKGEK